MGVCQSSAHLFPAPQKRATLTLYHSNIKNSSTRTTRNSTTQNKRYNSNSNSNKRQHVVNRHWYKQGCAEHFCFCHGKWLVAARCINELTFIQNTRFAENLRPETGLTQQYPKLMCCSHDAVGGQGVASWNGRHMWYMYRTSEAGLYKPQNGNVLPNRRPLRTPLK